MFVKVCLLIVLATVVMSAPTEAPKTLLSSVAKPKTIDERWTEFKTKHNKSYESPEEEKKRFDIFKERVEKIDAHNEKHAAGQSTFTQGINQFTDLTEEEVSKNFLGLNRPKGEGALQTQPKGEGALLGSH